jgi:hypothetical protein
VPSQRHLVALACSAAVVASVLSGLVCDAGFVEAIGRLPGETSPLSLIWAVLELASRGWRGITMTPKAVARIGRLRRALAVSEPLAELSSHEEGSPLRNRIARSRARAPVFYHLFEGAAFTGVSRWC